MGLGESFQNRVKGIGASQHPLLISALLLLLGIGGAAARAPGAGAAQERARGGPRKFPPFDPAPQKPWGTPLADNERRITILGTNDIHGGLEPFRPTRGIFKGRRQGGLAFFSGVVKAVRQGVAKRDGERGGVLVVDAGDQFQGTLVSNVNEGRAVLEAMAAIGYDAIVPGNHDYDFGPIDWKLDEARNDAERRQALDRALASLTRSRIPLLSANTFERASIAYLDGPAEPALGVLCQPGAVGRGERKTPLRAIDFARARRPGFLSPFTIKTVAGLRVALIGLDHPSTPTTTTARNVDDLCFSEEVGAYRSVVAQLAAQRPDLYVIVAHDGNAGEKDRALERVIRDIRAAKLPLDAVVSGHTHYTYAEFIDGIPVIQSGSKGGAFGRIDLIWDATARRLTPEKTKLAGGIPLVHDACARNLARGLCTEEGGKPRYEGEPVTSDPVVERIAKEARDEVPRQERLHDARLGTLDGEIATDRTDESPLANAITDAFRAAARTDVALVNTGGLRAPITPHQDRGNAFYFEDLFAVLPFANHGVIVRVSWDTLQALLQRSIQSCGNYGALMQSGLWVEFKRDCGRAKDGVDAEATLIRVYQADAKKTLLFDAQKGVRPPAEARFSVATFDFLAKGGSGYGAFAQGTQEKDLGILRDVLAEALTGQGGKARWRARLDGRWKNLAAPRAAAPAQEVPQSVDE